MRTTSIILIILLSIVNLSQAQKLSDVLPLKDGKINFSETVNVDSTKKDILYSKSKLWFANTFKSAKDVIQLDDKENGIILGKGIYQDTEKVGLAGTIQRNWKFTIKIQLKDAKYKAEIYDIDLTTNQSNPPTTASMDWYFGVKKLYDNEGNLKTYPLNFAKEINTIFSNLLADIKKSMTEKITSDF